MIEKIYELTEVEPVIFYGLNNQNIRALINLCPKIHVVARGSLMKISGDEKDLEQMDDIIDRLVVYCSKYNRLTEDVVCEIVRGSNPACPEPSNLILYGMSGKAITARTPGQKKFVELCNENQMVFAVGPAGSGKTYVAIAMAVKALRAKEVRRIILSRPAVEAGEKLGFLPGDMKEKIDPYLQPLYDALQDMVPGAKLKEFMENGAIQIAPLAFMRGRTLNDAFVILDEAQNTTPQQIKMFLTRLGHNSRMVITGDMTQVDLPQFQKSGLKDALEILKDVEGIGCVYYDNRDIVRHELVGRIVKAYEIHKDKENQKSN